MSPALGQEVVGSKSGQGGIFKFCFRNDMNEDYLTELENDK